MREFEKQMEAYKKMMQPDVREEKVQETIRKSREALFPVGGDADAVLRRICPGSVPAHPEAVVGSAVSAAVPAGTVPGVGAGGVLYSEGHGNLRHAVCDSDYSGTVEKQDVSEYGNRIGSLLLAPADLRRPHAFVRAG